MRHHVRPNGTAPAVQSWRTPDKVRVDRRRQRAGGESFLIENSDPAHPIFSNFRVKSSNGLTYSVEVRDVRLRQFGCQCADFRNNGLGTCKHVEAVLVHLQGRFQRLFRAASAHGAGRPDLLPDAAGNILRLSSGLRPTPPSAQDSFDAEGVLIEGTPETALGELKRLAEGRTADRTAAFAQGVRERLKGALVRCEEQFPVAAPHSVLYVVVERDAARWREQLGVLHREFFGSEPSDALTAARLEVVDRAADEAVRRLTQEGVLSRTTRASRALWPAEGGVAPPPLSEAERVKAASLRSRAARKLKMAGVLCNEDLEEEARQALLEAIEPLGCALAVENRLPEPQSLEDALLPPLGAAWKEALPLVREVLRRPSQPLPPVLSALGRV